ncbi:MAG: hypothetical protein ABIU10_08025, partial [Sphingomicrobium sp.]
KIAMVAYVVLPFLVALVPGVLPRRFSVSGRWVALVIIVALSSAYYAAMRSAPHPFYLMALVPCWIGSLVSFSILATETIGRRESGPKPQ